jgi:hypothetical protein
MKRFSVISSLILAIVLITTQSAFAARIYNLLPTPVLVTGMLSGIGVNSVTLGSGQKSDSIGWGSANYVRVDPASKASTLRTTDRPLCQVTFGVHAHIQGGNYMTIGHRGSDIVCTVCGSEHNAMAQNIERTDYAWQGSSHTGC